MRRVRKTAFFLVVAAGVGSALYLALHPADLLRDARTAFARGDLHAAQLDLDSYLKGHPRNPEASFRLGLVDLAEQNGVAAERNLRIARSGGYDRRAIIVPLGRAYGMQQHFDEALADFSPDAAPPDMLGEVLAVRALIYLGLHQVAPARDAASRALALAPDDPDVGLAAARVTLAAGDFAAAQAAVAHVLARDPARPEALLLQSDLKLSRGDAAGALSVAQAVLAASPLNLDAKLAAARALAALRRDDEAIALLDDVRRAAPRSIDAHYLRAVLAVRRHDYATADSQLGILSPVIDSLPLGNYLLAVTKLARGQPAQAEDAASANALRNPDDQGATRLLALTELAVGRPDRARAALQRLLDPGPPDAETLDLLARAQAMEGHIGTAAQTLAQAAALAPKNIDVLNRLAAADLQLGDIPAGQDALRRSLAAVPDQPAATEQLVQAALEAGDMATANAAVEKLRQAETAGGAHVSESVGVLTGRIRAAGLDFAGARQAYADVLARFPDSRGAVLGLIQVDGLVGDTDAARARLATWMKVHPTDADGLALQLKAARAAGNADAAIAAVTAAHAADPANAAFTETLARLYLDTNQAQRAGALLERAANTSDGSLLKLRAEAQARQGNADEARRLFLQAEDTAPNDPGPRLGLMALKLEAHDYAGARNVLADALDALPGNPQVLQAAVAVELRAGGRQAALARAATLAADPRNRPAALSLAGSLLAANGDQKSAADAYLASFRQAPSSTLAIETASSLARSGRPPAAINLLADWVGGHANDVAALQLLASLCLTMHQPEAAARWLNRVLVLRPNDVVALNNSAWVKLAVGDIAGARALAQRAYTIAPGPETQDTLGWTIARQGDTDVALSLLQHAAAAKPDQTVLYHEAFVLNAAGHADDARATLDRALADPHPFDERNAADRLRKQLMQ